MANVDSVVAPQPCEACPAGQFQPLDDHRDATCSLHNAALGCPGGLPGGEAVERADSLISDRQCNACAVGKYKVGTSTTCADQVVSLDDCLEFEILLNGDSTTAQATCRACPAGHHLFEAGVCADHTQSSCASGLFLAVAPSGESDGRGGEGPVSWCQPAERNVQGIESCIDHATTSCAQGSYLDCTTQPTVRSDGACTACPANTLQLSDTSDGGREACTVPDAFADSSGDKGNAWVCLFLCEGASIEAKVTGAAGLIVGVVIIAVVFCVCCPGVCYQRSKKTPDQLRKEAKQRGVVGTLARRQIQFQPGFNSVRTSIRRKS